MTVKAIRYLICGWCLALVLPAVCAEGALISFGVYELFQEDGSVTFAPSMGALFDSDTTLIAPDGSQSPFDISLSEGIPFTEFSTRFFGTWTIRSASNPAASATFVFSPFEPKPAPTITSPLNGSIVPIQFPLRWTNPVTPGASEWVISTDGADARLVGLPTPGMATLRVDLHGMGPASLEIRAGYVFSLSSLIGPLIPGSTPRAEADTFISRNLNVLSSPVHVTVVPEADSLTLAALGILGLIVAAKSRRHI